MTQDGVLAVFGDLSIWAGGDSWKEHARAIVQDILGHHRRAGDGTYRRTQHDYEEDLAAAGFTGMNRTKIPVARRQRLESVIGLLHSMSFASPALLGDRLNEFDNRIRDALTPLADSDGYFTDHNEFYLLTAIHP
jgi:hypothetical protein